MPDGQIVAHGHDTARSGPVLRTRGLTLSIAGETLVRDLDLTFANDGVAVILGPNGAGKSMLLRMLHGLMAPTGGEILWDDTLATEATRREQAMVFQKPVLLRRSVAANIDFVLKSRRRPEPGLRDRLLGMVDLRRKAGQAAASLSGGEQQRLALARALALKPRVLFLDEPTASLDPATTQLIEAVITDVARQGVRVICVTHDLGQARRIAGEVLLLHEGRAVEHAETREFFGAPRSQVTLDYLDGRLLVE